MRHQVAASESHLNNANVPCVRIMTSDTKMTGSSVIGLETECLKHCTNYSGWIQTEMRQQSCQEVPHLATLISHSSWGRPAKGVAHTLTGRTHTRYNCQSSPLS